MPVRAKAKEEQVKHGKACRVARWLKFAQLALELLGCLSTIGEQFIGHAEDTTFEVWWQKAEECAGVAFPVRQRHQPLVHRKKPKSVQNLFW